MTAFSTATFSTPESGTVVDAFGRHIIRITADQTGGSLGLFEAEVPAGEGPPFHVHGAEEEFFRVLSGVFGFWCGSDYVELSAGGTIVIPRGAAHRFQNVGTGTGRLMVVMTPGGFEGFFAAVAAEKPASDMAMAALAARFHLSFVPAPEAWAA